VSEYSPGQIVIATVRDRWLNVRLMRIKPIYDYVWMAAEPVTVSGAVRFYDHDLTNVRPLYTLDIEYPDAVVVALEAGARCADWVGDAKTWLPMLIKQIKAQVPKPSRIDEPGLYGVVEAGHKHLDGGRRSRFVRLSLTGPHQWVEVEAEADWCTWDDLINPIEIREGMSMEEQP
jgi:hypothetical protein